MTEPQIVLGYDPGFHNRSPQKTAKRIKTTGVYRDLSTVCVIPTRGNIPSRVAETWMGMMTPMNQPFVRLWVRGMEVGAAYEKAIDIILTNDMIKNFKYLLTLEEDNMPPPDGLLKLYENMDDYQIVGGLYFTKGEGGMPMIYGDPKGILAFNPQRPLPGKVQECNGVGMGFTLFDLDLFRQGKIERPFFKSVQSREEGQGTQDLYFMANARRAGYRVASDNRVRVGHYDSREDMVW